MSKDTRETRTPGGASKSDLCGGMEKYRVDGNASDGAKGKLHWGGDTEGMTGLADDEGEEFFMKERASEPSQRCEQAWRARGVQGKITWLRLR